MFTGLIEEVATLRRIETRREGARLEITAARVLEDVALGDSICVNGVCLTVTAFTKESFHVDAVPETMRRTNLGKLRTGDRVNLERALAAGARFGGHIVSGHVDGTGRLQQRDSEGNAVVLTIQAPRALMRYIAEKGSICVDGVSLTVMDVTLEAFRVSVIPHTGIATTLLRSPVGATLNLECDVIAKYVERLLGISTAGVTPLEGDVAVPDGGGLSLDFLRNHGFV
ncbi:riboflavin synthase [Alicyclobacillus sp. ALC3]|uniref:riboflavin synthase n=1 Tax=Alicyclobacillus sp. ALC3 TaxID=2796143 RepID=UPI002378599E|nr:riboflavin synthase [Alicyclobacillus sp. ALC3]WDL95581.1 riboflavin synthase [Alicyclobacillus sp. ALC3]